MAFNAKNLTYDKSEPAFLQRLKAGYASQDGRNNIQHARSGKSRLKTGDGDEDDPVILDERGEVVEKVVYEGMMKGEPVEEIASKDDVLEAGTKDQKEPEKESEGEKVVEKQKVAEIGVAKKRKAVKVVGIEDGDHEDERKSEQQSSSSKDAKRHLDQTVNGDDGKKLAGQKPKKKAKKIKLSFDEPE